MISIICGKKGSGKTKRLLEMANESIETSKGEIVYVDVTPKSMYKLDRNIRFANVSEFSIKGYDEIFGFINGLIAQNYDIDQIYLDNILNIANSNKDDLESFLNDLIMIGQKFQVKFIFTTNCDDDQVPEFLEQYILALV